MPNQAVRIESLSLKEISESPFNPRKTFDGIEELAEDVKLRGVLQPVLVRPVDDGYQLVFGARRYRAAKLAELKTIPAMVREMSDVEALEVAIVENAKRADVHPLEEADAYRELHTKHGYDVDTIAAKVGKSRAAVYARMKLCELGEAGRKAFFEGKLNASTALLVARIPDQEAQAKALEDISRPRWDGGVPSFREAVRIVQQHYTQDLKRAPFDTKDEFLIAQAGACGPCPKRSGNNPDLFGDLDGADVCTDGKCFAQKVQAHTAAKVSEAKAAGHQVLEEKAAEKALSYGGGYVKLDERCFEDPKGRTYAQLLKKADVEKVVAIDNAGAARELVPLKDAVKAIKETSSGEWTNRLRVPGARRNDVSQDKSRAKEKEAAKFREQVVPIALEQLGKAAAKAAVDAEFWRFIADLVVERCDLFDDDTALAKAIQVPLGRDDLPEAGWIDRWVKNAGKPAELKAFVVLALVARDAAGGSWQSDYDRGFSGACERFGVDLKGIEKDLKALAAAPAKQATEPIDDGKRCGLLPAKKAKKGCIHDQGHEDRGEPLHSNGLTTWRSPKPKKGRAA
jgi:ParB/RepB/Spo0J family partition protein